MAEGGSEFNKSAKESDFVYDFPCEKDGRNVEAVKHCVDCGENLCGTCLTHHNRFAMTRGHRVLDQVKTSQVQTKPLPSQRCSKHGGKIIDVFCPKHDTVGCSTCISVDHSSCKGKKFIPDIAVGIKTSKELKQLEADMKTCRSKLNALKNLTGGNLQRLKQDKDDLKKQIQTIRKKINEQLDNMEKELLNEADKKFKEKIDAIHTSLAEVDDMLARVKHAMDQVKSDANDADIFVSCKIAKQDMLKEIYTLHAKLEERLPERSFELHTDDATKLLMEGKRLFASINEKYTIRGSNFKEDINIRTNDDREICTIHAICVLPDECLVISDFSNKKLKKLDTVTCDVSTIIDLPDNPNGICLVGNSRLAVSLVYQKKIQFVSLSSKVTLDNSFSVGDRCRGLAHCDGLLYVCCGGIPGRNEGFGHVEVYSCTGTLLRCLYEDCNIPEFIHVTNDGNTTTIYIADFREGLQVRSTDGAVKYRYSTVLGTDLPFCLIGPDQVCVGELSTGNIYLQTNKDKRLLVGGNEVDGQPLGLCFVKRSSRLLVALENCDVIKSFTLNVK